MTRTAVAVATQEKQTQCGCEGSVVGALKCILEWNLLTLLEDIFIVLTGALVCKLIKSRKINQ